MKKLFITSLVLMATSIPALGAVKVSVHPQTALFDQPISIVVTGLKPVTKVSLTLTTKDAKGNTWRSHATFYSNLKGVVNLRKTLPYSGTYSAIQGIFPMGLFWSMKPPSNKPNLRFVPRRKGKSTDAYSEKTVYHLRVVVSGKTAANADIVRRFVAANVATKEVRRGDLFANLYYPRNFKKDGRKHPAMITLGGSEGGIESAAIVGRWLASHGFVVMATAWYDIGPLPKNMVRVPVKPVREAASYLQKLPFVNPGEIGAWGGSWGGILALFSAVHISQIHAVVSALGPPIIGSGISRKGKAPSNFHPVDKSPFIFHGKPVPFATFKEVRKFFKTGDRSYIAEAFIPIARIKGPVLFISAGDDKLAFSGIFSHLAMQTLHQKHHFDSDEFLYYPNAGHLIFPGYWPVANRSRIGKIRTGGTAGGYARADAEVGPETIGFLKKALKGSGR